HAVLAAQVAAVGDRQAQVAQAAAEEVARRCRFGWHGMGNGSRVARGLIVRSAFDNNDPPQSRARGRRMSHPLSRKQLDVLRALEAFSHARGHVPSVRELAARLRKSPTTVFQHLKALERRGYLQGDGSAHGWKLLRREEESVPDGWV